MAAPIVRSVTTATVNSLSTELAVPTNTAAGDLLILLASVSTAGATNSIVLPEGFTPFIVDVPDYHGVFAYRIVQADDPVSYTIGYPDYSNSNRSATAFVRITGHHARYPIHLFATYVGSGNGTTTGFNSPSIETKLTDTLVIKGVLTASGNNGLFTTPSSLTALWNFSTGASSGPSVGAGTITQSSAGTIEADNWRSAYNFTQIYSGFAIAISPIDAPNLAPIANAGANQTVDPGALVMLDGSDSTDPENEALSYIWRQISGPAVTLSSTTVAQPTFTAPSDINESTLTFGLTVTDDNNLSSSEDTITINVAALPYGFVRKNGTWEKHRLYVRQNGTWQ